MILSQCLFFDCYYRLKRARKVTQERKVKREMLGQLLAIVVCRLEPVIYFYEIGFLFVGSYHFSHPLRSKFSNLSSNCSKTTFFSFKAIVLLLLLLLLLFFNF